jgi:hypothetical protein
MHVPLQHSCEAKHGLSRQDTITVARSAGGITKSGRRMSGNWFSKQAPVC